MRLFLVGFCLVLTLPVFVCAQGIGHETRALARKYSKANELRYAVLVHNKADECEATIADDEVIQVVREQLLQRAVQPLPFAHDDTRRLFILATLRCTYANVWKHDVRLAVVLGDRLHDAISVGLGRSGDIQSQNSQHILHGFAKRVSAVTSDFVESHTQVGAARLK